MKKAHTKPAYRSVNCLRRSRLFFPKPAVLVSLLALVGCPPAGTNPEHLPVWNPMPVSITGISAPFNAAECNNIYYAGVQNGSYATNLALDIAWTKLDSLKITDTANGQTITVPSSGGPTTESWGLQNTTFDSKYPIQYATLVLTANYPADYVTKKQSVISIADNTGFQVDPTPTKITVYWGQPPPPASQCHFPASTTGSTVDSKTQSDPLMRKELLQLIEAFFLVRERSVDIRGLQANVDLVLCDVDAGEDALVQPSNSNLVNAGSKPKQLFGRDGIPREATKTRLRGY